MKLTNAYTVPHPPDMNIISEPGIPRSVCITMVFDNKNAHTILDHGSTPSQVAAKLRRLANRLDEL